MPLPLPLHGFNGGDKANVGTGFLVTSDDTVWLVTCIHVFTGLRDNPATTPLDSGIANVVGTSTVVSLSGVGPGRFSVVNDEKDNILFDVIAIRLTADEVSVLSDYGAYDISSIIPPEIGATVTATGFPGMEYQLIDAKTLTGEIEEVYGVSVKLTVPGAPGWSGSALVADDGLIGILHGDVGIAPDLTNGLAISFEEIGPLLFA